MHAGRAGPLRACMQGALHALLSHAAPGMQGSSPLPALLSHGVLVGLVERRGEHLDGLGVLALAQAEAHVMAEERRRVLQRCVRGRRESFALIPCRSVAAGGLRSAAPLFRHAAPDTRRPPCCSAACAALPLMFRKLKSTRYLVGRSRSGCSSWACSSAIFSGSTSTSCAMVAVNGDTRGEEGPNVWTSSGC